MAADKQYLPEVKKFKLIGWLSGVTQSQIDKDELKIQWFLDGAEKAVGEKLSEKIVQRYVRIAGLVPFGPIHPNAKNHYSVMAALKDRVARLEAAVFNGNKAAN